MRIYKKESCAVCKKQFDPTRSKQKYCSRLCYYDSRTGVVGPRAGQYVGCGLCQKSFYIYPGHRSRGRGFFCSKICSNKSRTGKKMVIRNPNPYWKGKKLPEETKRKISETRKRIGVPQPKGEKAHRWKGGVTPKNKLIRKSLAYRQWRTAVFQRDNYTCIWCGVRSGNGKAVVLNADHIKPFAFYPELRFDLDNGRTLCASCHRKTNTWGRYERKD